MRITVALIALASSAIAHGADSRPNTRENQTGAKQMIRDIVFSAAPDGDEDIYVMNPDGGNVRRLTQITGPGILNRTPEWSPDGLQIAFQSNRDGAREIYILTTATKEVRRLTQANGVCSHPAWSPDGKQIIYVSDRGNGSSLFIINTDGSNERPISPVGTKGRHLFNPTWVPGSTRIAFILQGRNGAPDSLWTSNIDGSAPVQVGPQDLSIFEYDYSPDGTRIVFDAKVSNEPFLGDWDIFTMRADGSDLRRLTDLKAMSSRPKWLSDGETIVFHSNRFGDKFGQPATNAPSADWFNWWNQFEILAMDSNGENIRRLTANQLRDLHPDG